jgi:hypothetical protein
MEENKKISPLLKDFIILLIFFGITLLVFSHRFQFLNEAYGLGDVDTDGTLWYYWAKIFTSQNGLLFNKIDLIAFPVGYNVDYIPFSNLLYDVILILLKINEGYKDINSIILVSNIFSLATYPLHAFSTYLLIKYLTKSIPASFIGGLIAGFSYYFVLMGRGALSLNHVYWIPLNLLFVYKALRERTVMNIIISSFLFSIMFGINAYWAFYTGIFIVAIVFFELYSSLDLSKFQKLSFLIKYFVSISFITLLLNFQFFNNFFETYSKFNQARIVSAEGELISIVEYFNPSKESLIYSFGNGGGWFLGYIALVLGLLGLFILKKGEDLRIYIFIMLCLLVGVLLSVNINGLLWFNEIYFKYFGMFRAVSRLNILVSIFLAIMCGFTIKLILEKIIISKYFNSFFLYVSFIILCCGIVMEGLNKDPSWKQLTFVTPIEEVYEIIRDSKEINIIAQYPMKLSNREDGIPSNYQLVGQIIHQKKLVAGADPFNKDSIDFYSSIKNIEVPETIDILKQNGVDTLVINSKFFKNGNKIVSSLKNDERLVYLGNYQGNFNTFKNKGYKISRYNEASAHIDVFRIK